MSKSKFLSRDGGGSKATYKQTLVWQWLQHVEAGTDELGYAIKQMRKRVDMVDKFPHKTYLLNYLTERCKIDVSVAVHVLDQLWNMYAGFRDDLKRSQRVVGEVHVRSAKAEPDEIPRLKSDSQWLSR